MLCCGYTLTDYPISIRLTSLALWQSNDCPSASKATLMNMDKYFTWIHYERLHNHNKAKHNKTVCIFLRIYCISRELWHGRRFNMNVVLSVEEIRSYDCCISTMGLPILLRRLFKLNQPLSRRVISKIKYAISRSWTSCIYLRLDQVVACCLIVSNYTAHFKLGQYVSERGLFRRLDFQKLSFQSD